MTREQGVQGQRKKRSNIVLGSTFELPIELEHRSALILFQNCQKTAALIPVL